MYKPALITGAILGMLGVIIGAMGAHAVKQIVTPERLALYTKGVEYHFYHVFAILACGIIYASFPNKSVANATWLFVSGIICFSGSLYALTFYKGEIKELGLINLITPLGGVLMIAGWVMLVIGIMKK